MAETQLISINDIQTYRRIDPKFDVNRFNAFVTDVQRKNLRNLFGDALYYAFMNDARTGGIYYDLLTGKIYTYESNTIQFYGIKPFLCYCVLAILARESEMFISTYGAVEFVNNSQQSFEKSKEKERIAVGYMETAQYYANDVIQFLNEHSTSYPLWVINSEKKTTEFTTFKL